MKKSKIQNTDIDYSYIFDANQDLKKYFAMKKKHDHAMMDAEYAQLKAEILSNVSEKYDLVIVPQTSNLFLYEIASSLGKEVVIVDKNSKQNILELLDTQNFMKAEKQKLFQSIEDMGHEFKINKIAGNQRKRFIEILFQPISQDFLDSSKILVLDDSIFSGHTMQALLYQVNQKISSYEILSLFSKQT